MGLATTASLKTRKKGKYRLLFILLAVLLLISWGAWRIIPYHTIIPQSVRLKSAVYLRSPHVYRHDTSGYDPEQAPLEPEWVRLNLDRENNQAFFESSTGERVQVTLGEPQWIKGCENQFRVEAFRLADELALGSIAFHEPVLIVACDMWALGEKVRPVRLVLKEGPISEIDPFYMGMECNPNREICMSFAEALIELVVTVVEADSRQALPYAHVTISSGMGIQEFTGGLRLPVYTAMQLEYHISMPGYMDKDGEISNFYGNKMEIMYFTNADRNHGMGDIFDLPVNFQEVDYSIELSKE